MIMLMLLLAPILKVEGNSDWCESAFKIQSLDCSTPTMINKLHLPDHCFIPTKKLTEKTPAAPLPRLPAGITLGSDPRP